MRLAADDRLGGVLVHIGVFKQPQLELGNQNPAAGVREQRLVHAVHQLRRGAHARAAQHIRARVGSAHEVEPPVGLDDALVAQLPAQQIGHDRSALVSGVVHRIAAQIGYGGVAIGHDRRHARINGGLEARQM